MVLMLRPRGAEGSDVDGGGDVRGEGPGCAFLEKTLVETNDHSLVFVGVEGWGLEEGRSIELSGGPVSWKGIDGADQDEELRMFVFKGELKLVLCI
jgi:hypothetical protein